MDEALDKALAEHLEELFGTFFKHSDEVKLMSELRSAEEAYNRANKALDKL